MDKIKLKPINIGNAGEHYVAAELERKNFTPSVVGNNCKDYDIIAVNNENHTEVLIQVKCSTNKNRWRVNQSDFYEDKLFYVLVSLEEANPKYYILTSKKAFDLKERNHNEFCERNGYEREDKKMREIVLNDELLKKYENNWQIIMDYCFDKK